MKVREAKLVAKRWVDERAAHLPGFHGAYLAGGINRMSDDEEFPHYVDLDVHVVLERAMESGQRQDLILYRGVVIEALYLDRNGYESAEAVLANPLEAQNFITPGVLADPTGALANIQTIVAREFSRRKWVEMRCGLIRAQMMDVLSDEEKSSSMSLMVLLLLNIPYLLANAHLKAPTNRRAYCQIREILHAGGRHDLYESILALQGVAHRNREETEVRLQECIRAFDRAVEVFKTPFWSDNRIHSYVRPYLLDGAREMIEAGDHREAMPWITWNHVVAITALQNDAPEEEKRQFQEAYERLYDDPNTWYGKQRTWPTRDDAQRVRRVVDELLRYVDEAIARNPEIREA